MSSREMQGSVTKTEVRFSGFKTRQDKQCSEIRSDVTDMYKLIVEEAKWNCVTTNHVRDLTGQDCGICHGLASSLIRQKSQKNMHTN